MKTTLSTLIFVLVFSVAPGAMASSRYAPLFATPAGQDTLKNLALWEDQRVTGDGELFDYLGASNPLVRRRAVEVVGRIQDPQDVPRLTAMLDETDPRVLREVLFAIGQIGSEDAMPALVEFCEDTRPRFLLPAAEAAGKIGGPVAIALLSRLLHDFDSRVRAEAALALARTEDPTAVNPLLLAIHDPDADVAGYAIYGLEKNESKRAAEKVLPFLGHDNPMVRAYAARTLGKQKDDKAVGALSEALKDRDLAVAVNAARALGLIGDNRAVHPLGDVIAGHPSQQVRRAAVEALGEIGDKKGKDYVIQMLMAESVGLRVASIDALAKILGDDVELFAEQQLDDGHRLVRAAAIDAMGTGQVKNSIETLSRIARTNDDAMLRAAAVRALAAMEDDAIGEMLVSRISDKDWVVATEAVLGVGEQEYREGARFLIETYALRTGREEVNIRMAILQVLTGFAEQGAANIAQDALHDPDKRIRTLAVELLAAIGLPTEAPSDREIYQANFDAARRRFLMPPTGSRHAVITTQHGDIELELLGDDAIQTVASFVALTKRGFYDGLTFHRVVPNFVAQGGDPRGDGWGDAGYFIRSEFSRYRYETGFVGIAHDGKDTGGCQFFITHSPQHHLDGRYTIFGRVTRGMETVYKIDQGDTFTARIVE